MPWTSTVESTVGLTVCRPRFLVDRGAPKFEFVCAVSRVSVLRFTVEWTANFGKLLRSAPCSAM